ncbi:MAG: nucleotidyltransferase domain-containing protein [Bacteroidota bacterium]|nr:nucleotidyltransferase domain-containing protein [Bacteroidota bacterium]
MLTTEKIKQTVTEYFKDKPVKKVYLFGSYARGEANEKSDVDLLLDIAEDAPVTYFTLGGYLADMQDAFKIKVDLVPDDSVYEHIRKNIEREKLLLFEA